MTDQLTALSSVLDASRSPMALLSLEGRITLVNRACRELVGHPRDRLVGAGLAELVHPDDVRPCLEVALELAQGKRSGARITVRFLDREGAPVWSDVVLSALHDADGEVTCVLVQAVPAEGASPEQVSLGESEARFRAALDNAPIGMALVGLDGEWLQVNRVLCASLGRTPRELARLRVRDVMHPDDFARDEGTRRELLDGRIGWVRASRRFLRADGSAVWCDVTVTLIRDGPGEPVHLLLHVMDPSSASGSSDDFGEAHQLRALADVTDEVLFFRLRLIPDLCFEHVSDSVSALSGYSPQDFYGDPRLMFDLIHPDDAAQLLELLADPDHAAQELSFRWRHRDGHEIVTKARYSSVHRDGTAVALEGILVDVTRQREAERARLVTEERFRSLVQNSTDALIVTDCDGRISYATPSVERMLGWHPDQTIGTNLWDQVHVEDRPKLRRAYDGSSRTFTVRLRTRSGSWRWMEAVATDMTDDPAVAGVVVNARDIHDQWTAEEALRDSAVTDVLTRLPNRALIRDRIGRALLRHRDDPAQVAVLTVNLDRFKTVNDALGHESGDRVLVEVGSRLVACAPDRHTVGRFAADEFIVCAEGLCEVDGAREYAERLRAAVTGPIEVAGETLRIDASVGVTLADTADVSADELLRRSMSAARSAKGAGGGRIAFYDPEQSGRAKARQQREQGLLDAADRGELVAHYQPIIDLESGRAVGAEALVRWSHPVDGMVPPSEFIAIAEENGAITAIGAWVLDDACRNVRRWRGLEGLGAFTVSVNLAARQLADSTIVDVLATTLARHGLPSDALTVEVTESAALGHGHLEVLHDIHALGVSIALDDFGTHYSSLSYLQRLPVQHLKIDQSFVTGITTDRQRRAIVMATGQLGRALRLTTVAEGVEDAQEAAELRLLGIDRGQGFFFGRPTVADELTELLERHEPFRVD